MKIIFTLLVVMVTSAVQCQSISRQVISSSGAISNSTISSSTAGPSILFTSESSGDILLTQGFQQPSSGALMVDVVTTDPTCFNPTGGLIVIIISGCSAPYEITLNGEDVEESIEDLSQGTYTLEVSAGACSFTSEVTLSLDTECGDFIPNVLALNGDGANESWVIPFLFNTENADNTVQIVNRWGQLVWEASQYDNTSIVWVGQDTDGNALPTGTYFYQITTPERTETGYIELLK